MPIPTSIGRRFSPGADHHRHEMGQPRYVALRAQGPWWVMFDRERRQVVPVFGSKGDIRAMAEEANREARGES